MKENIRIINPQVRFETWAAEDQPIIVDPNAITVKQFQPDDLLYLVNIYQKVFNSQNQRLYRGVTGARLIWDEEPWTSESAKAQLEEELFAPSSICLVARAPTIEGSTRPVGFIVARPVISTQLTAVCGSEKISGDILSATGNSQALLWEDAATLNLRTNKGETIRGVGTNLYQTMALIADNLAASSIGRTSPGSYAEKILPKVGFRTTQPPIQDGKDKQRYWLIRQYEK